MSDATDINESAAKLALDNAENDGVPELQSKAANFNDRGGLVLILPRHPAVTAFIRELDAMKYEAAADLKAARLHLRTARKDYDVRVSRRITNDIPGLTPLSDILIARAAAKHWHQVVAQLEHAARVNKSHRWAKAYAGLIRL